MYLLPLFFLPPPAQTHLLPKILSPRTYKEITTQEEPFTLLEPKCPPIGKWTSELWCVFIWYREILPNNELLIDTTQINLGWKSDYKRAHTVWFHIYTILENSCKSILKVYQWLPEKDGWGFFPFGGENPRKFLREWLSSLSQLCWWSQWNTHRPKLKIFHFTWSLLYVNYTLVKF